MKTRTKTLLAAFMLLAISCKKESTTIQSSRISDESATQSLSTDINEPGVFASIKIGSQVVMKKNLNVRRYRNGDLIPQVKDAAAWAALTTGAWCWYNNDSANGAIYGRLYNWYAVNDPRGLAPEGWHIPSDSEWTAAVTLLGGDAVAGGKMKETGTTHWLAPNTGATNSSGFTGLPGGGRSLNGIFGYVGYRGYLWSSTEASTHDAGSRHLYYNNGSISRNTNCKSEGLSVRCVKD